MELTAAFNAAKKGGVDLTDYKDWKVVAKDLTEAEPTAKMLIQMKDDMGGDGGGDGAPDFFVGLYAKKLHEQRKALAAVETKIKAYRHTLDDQLKGEKDAKRKKALADLKASFDGVDKFIKTQNALPGPEKFSKEIKKMVKEANQKAAKKDGKAVQRKVKINKTKPGESFVAALKAYQEEAPDLNLAKVQKYASKLALVDKLVQSHHTAEPKLKVYQEFLRKPDPNSPRKAEVDGMAPKIDKLVERAEILSKMLEAVHKDLRSLKGKSPREQKVLELAQEDLEEMVELLQPIVECRDPELARPLATAKANIDAAVERFNKKAAPAKT
jgi:archaellum component FlaC